MVNSVNESCLRLSTFEGPYQWHHHPASDGLFVVDGQLEIDFADRPTLCIRARDRVTIPAGVVHRTRAVGRTTNVTFEHLGAATTFVDAPVSTAEGSTAST